MDNNSKRPKPVVLVILDGWGVKQDYSGNAITQAKTPNFDSLVKKYPSAVLSASGNAVGLPNGQAGNSEIGHMNLGSGRIIEQDLLKIDNSIKNKTFFKNQTLLKATEHVKKNNSKLHLIGLISEGKKHASLDHLFSLIDLVKNKEVNDVFLHLILDGLDVSGTLGVSYLKLIEDFLGKESLGKIASVSGRFYAMDRENHWERTAKAYKAIARGDGRTTVDIIKELEESYEKKIFDEEFLPTVILEGGKPRAIIDNNDALIFFNFRQERMRQLVQCFVEPDFSKIEEPKHLKNTLVVGFTTYGNLAVESAFKTEKINDTLSEIIAKNNLTQLHISETEKFSHVTYFFNGCTDEKFQGEDDIVISSPIVSSYADKPEMSINKVVSETIKAISKNSYDFILINLANLDMVGHTGNLKAAVKAVKAVDLAVNKIIKEVLLKNGVVVLVSDHGNVEAIENPQIEIQEKSHTTNPVPFVLVGEDFEGKNIGFEEPPSGDLSLLKPIGNLADVAPTILKILGLEKPKKMTGKELF